MVGETVFKIILISCFSALLSLSACGSKEKKGEKEKLSVPSEKITLNAPAASLGETTPHAETKPEAIPSPFETRLTPQEKTTTPPPTLSTQPTAEPAGEEIPFQPQSIQQGQAIEIIMDLSGSMTGILGSTVKLDLVKNTLLELMQQWAQIQTPPVQVGLRVFGSEAPIAEKKCDDTKLIYPINAIHLPKIQEQVTPLEAKGESPITEALKEAAKDLTVSSIQDKVILLLVDGADTCNQDPCALIDEWKKEGKSTIVHVIGFDLSQSDEPSLRCVAEKTGGEFFLARTEGELVSTLDQAFRSTVPYNLQLKVWVGASPLPVTLTVYKQNTQEVVAQLQSYGVQIFRLPAGTYDIQVEYTASPEIRKPAKMIKGVQLAATGKVEQEVRFDLAPVILSAIDGEKKPAKTRYTFLKAGTEESVAQYQSDGTEAQFYITAGSYDLVADRQEPADQKMSLRENNVTLQQEHSYTREFIFQTGVLALKGLNAEQKPALLNYKITPPDQPETVIAEGQTLKEGINIELPPGSYDILVAEVDPNVQAPPTGKAGKITIEGGKTIEQTVTVIAGTLALQSVLKGDLPIPAQFQLFDAKAPEKTVLDFISKEGKINFSLPPGEYTLETTYTPEFAVEKITQKQTGIKVEQGKTVSQKVVFDLGVLKLKSRNLKGMSIKAQFKIYRAGTEELIAESSPFNDWVIFNIPAGFYDVLATDTASSTQPKPTLWLRNVSVELANPLAQEAIFTTAKVKLIAMGKNNQVLKAHFKIYQYGSDTALFAGDTMDNWITYDIVPGNYYIEAGYVDRESSQLLKKWITLKVDENEIVEKTLRF